MSLRNQTHKKLREFFVSFVDAETHLEHKRQDLASNPDFEPYTAFQKIDQSNLGHLRVQDLANFLQKARMYVPEEDLELFFMNFASKGDMRLGYTDFLDAILPSTDRFLRQSATHRHKYHMDPTAKVDKNVDVELAELIAREVDVYKNMELLKEDVKQCSDWDVHLAFRLIDCNRNGYIDRDSLLNYIRKSGTLTREEIEPFFKRADKDMDGKWNYTEFVEIFHPFEKYYKSSEYLKKSAERIRKSGLQPQLSVALTEDSVDYSRKSRESSPHFSPLVKNNNFKQNSREDSFTEEKYKPFVSRRPLSRDDGVRPQRDLRSLDSSAESRRYIEKLRTAPVEESLNRSDCKISKNVQNYINASLNQSRTNESMVQNTSPSRSSAGKSGGSANRYVEDIITSAAKYSKQQAKHLVQQAMQHQLTAINFPQNYSSSPPRRVEGSAQSRRQVQKKLEFGDEDGDLSFRQKHFSVTEESPKQKSRRGSEGPRGSQGSRSREGTPVKSYALREEISMRTGKHLKDLQGRTKPWVPAGPKIHKSSDKQLSRSSSPSNNWPTGTPEKLKKAAGLQSRENSTSKLTPQKRAQSVGRMRTPQKTVEKEKNEPQERPKSTKKVRFGVAETPAPRGQSASSKGTRKPPQPEHYKVRKPSKMKGFEEVNFAKTLKEIIELERVVEKAKCELAMQEDFVPYRAYKQIFDETGKGLCGRVRFKQVLEDFKFALSSGDAGLVFNHFDYDHDGNFSPSDFEAIVTPKDPTVANRITMRKSTGRQISGQTYQKLKNVLEAAIFAELNVEKLRQALAKRTLFSFKEAFKILDLARAGRFGAREVQAFLIANKFNVSISEAGWVVARLDADRDGKVTFKEFVDGLESKLVLGSAKK